MDSIVQLTSDLQHYGPGVPPLVNFYATAVERGYSGFAKAEWLTAPGELLAPQDFGCRVLYHGRVGTFDRRDFFFLEGEDILVHIYVSDGELSITAACQGPDLAPAEKLIEHVRKLVPPNPPPPSDSIYLTFWALDPRTGPSRVRRRITIPSWKDIGANYPAPTDGKLAELMANFTPATGGQLLLLHGVAGTGKTYAIRALGREWRDWCSFEYITDPEVFFGEAGYMLNVLLQLGSGGGDGQAPAVAGGGAVEQEKPRERWQLLILEDTGELLTSDAKMRSGQGLSRFLNLADGLIGQGLNLLILVTTNEPIRELHAAVQRPGRCAANIEFERFGTADASDWLIAHSAPGEVVGAPNGQSTLADLYGILAGQKVGQTRPIGLGV